MTECTALTPRQQAVRAQAIAEFGQLWANARARMATLTPEAAAAEAYVPGGPSVEELADEIRQLRAESAARAGRAA